MPALVWDAIGDRTFETGVSKGVIYLDDGRSVVWNGLSAITETPGISVSPVHYDGAKVSDVFSPGDFSGTIAAYTYPNEMLEIEGYARLGAGVYIGEQSGRRCNLTYQTKIGNDVAGVDLGYKIHILYNVTLVPSEKSYETISNTVAVDPFEWSFTTIPEEVSGYRPTSRIVIDSRAVPPDILEQIELWLYGKNAADPRFPSFDELMGLLVNNYVVDITDLKDGRWTATTKYDGYISVDETTGEFQIDNVEATYIDPETYNVSDTLS